MNQTPVLYAFGCARGCYATVPVSIDTTPYTRCPVCGGPWVRDPPANPKAPARLKAEKAGAVVQEDGGFWR
jgi:hypothetical protein